MIDVETLLYLVCACVLPLLLWILKTFINTPATKPNIICIEANIGSGKTTLIRKLQDTLDPNKFVFFEEPVETKWKRGLQYLYSDQTRWNFTFQIENYLWWTHVYELLANQVANHAGKTIIVERSAESCTATFVEVAKGGNFYNEWEIDLLATLKSKLIHPPPQKYIYLRCDPETSYERLKIRSRSCESSVPLGYLQALHSNYESFFEKRPGTLVIDAEQDKETVLGLVKDFLHR